MQQIGYSIVDAKGQEVKFWGDVAGQLVSAPNPIDWPSGDRSYCPAVGMTNNGAKFVMRQLDEKTGDASEQIAFDGTQVVVTRTTPVPVIPPPPTPTQIDYQAAIETFINETARQRQYDSGISLAGYVASTVPQWVAEAQTFVAWRDAVWVYALTQLTLVEQGKRPQPSVIDFLAELPAIAWPT